MYVCQKKTVECALKGSNPCLDIDEIYIQNFTLDEKEPLLPAASFAAYKARKARQVAAAKAEANAAAAEMAALHASKADKTKSPKKHMQDARAEADKAKHAILVAEQKALFAAAHARRVGAKAAANARAAATAPKKARVERAESVAFMRAPSPPND